MYCDHCGNPNPDGSAFCAACGSPLATASRGPSPQTFDFAAAPDPEDPYDRERPLYEPSDDDFYDDEDYEGGGYGEEPYDVPQPYGEPFGYDDPYREDDPYRAQYLSQQQYRAEHGYQTLGSPGPRGKGPLPEEADGPLKEHRSLALYIILSILTLGIFGWYYIHCIARDTNVLCAADGERTTGVGLYVLFCILTLSIYSFYWMYRIGQRLYENAPAYGLRFERNGLVILLWDTIGALILVGPFIAMHHVLRELDELSAVYNERYVYNWG